MNKNSQQPDEAREKKEPEDILYYESSYGDLWMIDQSTKERRTITAGGNGIVEVGDFDLNTKQLIKGTRTYLEGGRIVSENIENFYSPTFYQGSIKYSDNHEIDQEIGYIELGRLAEGVRKYRDGLEIQSKSFISRPHTAGFFEDTSKEWSVIFPNGTKMKMIPNEPPRFENVHGKIRYIGKSNELGQRDGEGAILLADHLKIEATFTNDKIDFTQPYSFHYRTADGKERTYLGK